MKTARLLPPRRRRLPREFAAALNEFVRQRYLEPWQAMQDHPLRVTREPW